jgi:hypothetical protein
MVETKLAGQSGSLYKTTEKYFPQMDMKLLTHAFCCHTDTFVNRVLRIEIVIFRYPDCGNTICYKSKGYPQVERIIAGILATLSMALI